MTNSRHFKSLPVLGQYESVLDSLSMALMLRPQSKPLLQQKPGVRQIWMTQPPNLPDVLTTYAGHSKNIYNKPRDIDLPTYPRHPLVMAQQALAIHDLAPDRLRLGIGPSHRFIIENMYGLQHSKPLTHLREYLEVLRTALWDGKVDHHGEFFNVVATMAQTAQIPLLISTLGKMAFQLAGQIADGALTWVCPVSYLLDTGIPVYAHRAPVGRSLRHNCTRTRSIK